MARGPSHTTRFEAVPHFRVDFEYVDQGGVVDFLDISPFIAVLSTGEYLGQADINEDGTVSFLDIAPFIALLST